MNNDKKNQQSSQPRLGAIISKLRLGIASPMLMVAGIVIAGSLIVGVAVVYNNVFQKNAEKLLLVSALKNTLAAEQLKIDAKLSIKDNKNADSFSQNLAITGEYKKGAGLSATADSSMTSFAGIYLKVQSKWIVDATDKNSTYVNLTSYSTGTTPGAAFQYTPAMQKMVKQIVDNNNKSFNNVWAKYSEQLLRGTISNTGVIGCSPKIVYATIASSQEFQTLMSKLANMFAIQKTGSSPKTNSYTITVDSGKYNDASQVYLDSNLYKTLSACDPAAYATTKESIKDSLRNISMIVEVDKAKKIITSIGIKDKNVLDFKLNVSPTSGVVVAAPKVSTDILSDDPVKKYPQFSYDFQHLADSADLEKYGACYNYEKYKSLMPPEAIKTCENLQKQ